MTTGPAGNLICDLDGVVYLGGQPIPGSAAALTKFEESGWRVLFCTNNSSRTSRQVANRIESVTGFPVRSEQVVTSGQAAAAMLAPTKPATFVLGGEGITAALAEVAVPTVSDSESAGAVVVGLAVDLTYAWLRDAVTAVRGGARLVATNLDATYPTEFGEWPGGGAIVAAVETACGVKAEVAGKPYLPMRQLLAARLGPGQVWVVGDRPDTDIALAVAAGWSSALVLSGVVDDPAESKPSPDLVVANLAELAVQLLG